MRALRRRVGDYQDTDVDGDETVRSTVGEVLQLHGFDVTEAGSVSEALGCINSTSYEVLLTELHMPEAGDGLTVVSAMRNPRTITMVSSGFPEMDAAARAILVQTDHVLAKPMPVLVLVTAIKKRLTVGAPPPRRRERERRFDPGAPSR